MRLPDYLITGVIKDSEANLLAKTLFVLQNLRRQKPGKRGRVDARSKQDSRLSG